MTNNITYEQVEEYRKEVNGPLQRLLQDLETYLAAGRDNRDSPIPIYLTRWRVKSVNSIYIKTKRKKYESLDDITDYAGFRILCLFERDLIETTKYLASYLKREIDKMMEVKLFNWEEKGESKNIGNEIEAAIKHIFPDTEIEHVNQEESGYKSIHFLVYMVYHNQKYPIEIQVRTLFQDVWGELGHALVYKQGNVHPHIQKSFYLLSRDIQTNDLLMNHLRSISDKEKCVEIFSNRHTGPYKVFGYEDRVLPAIFKNEGKCKYIYSTYMSQVNSPRKEQELDTWIENAKNLYKEITTSIRKEGNENADEVWKEKYWINAEAGFLAFMKGDHDEAIKFYEKALNVERPRDEIQFYAPNFRIGEIYFIKGEIEKALVFFDQAENILQKQEEQSPGKERSINAYRGHVKMANVYWQLGREYVDRALGEIQEAEKIYRMNKTYFDEGDNRSLVNNLCWYYLEKYIFTKEKTPKDEEQKNQVEDAYIKAETKYKDLEKTLKDPETGANAFDTAMWFCLMSYYKTGELDFLKKAKEYCEVGRDKKIYSTNKILSLYVYRNHIQEIMSAN
ncbi:hypothetical protein [Nitrosospira sp. Nsp13]|uniref:hypothetical protein n=1 Tax=Nitrosospira sp. Nsp13 TaxID=1855332 RepID=UPI00087F83B2|nr:hypothetical protein [Nitrosospira sp. Nsp13]SCX86838.1 ppGpp synthetase catalytic domain-containing protein (RelA/SpoT-type nucleotidyltranferase) [Nitrosospira sp. Nsp13]